MLPLVYGLLLSPGPKFHIFRTTAHRLWATGHFEKECTKGPQNDYNTKSPKEPHIFYNYPES